MKKAFLEGIELAVAALFVGILLAFAFSASAHAAPVPEAVTSADGKIVYGTHNAYAVKRNTDSGNRTMVLYAYGWQYAADDAAFSKYKKFVEAIGARGLPVDNDPNGTVYAIANAIVHCYQGNTYMVFTGSASLTEQLSDGCAFWAKAKANSN